MSCDCNTLVVGEAGPQGPQGLSGTNGTNGTDGINAFTTVSGSSYTQPSVNGSVTFNVANNQWIGVGQAIYVSPAGYYQVASVSGSNQITATLKAVGTVAPGGTISVGSKVSPAAVATYSAPLSSLTVSGTSILDGALYVNQSNNDRDVVVEGTTDQWLFVSDASSNRVGVGVQTPEAKLHVSGTFKVGTSSSTSSDAEFTRGALFNSIQSTSGDFTVKTQNYSDTFVIDASANSIGIGTSSPARLLDIDGTGQTRAWIVNPLGDSTVDSTSYVFRVYGSGSTNSLVVDATNNYVGIRTGSPSTPLHVNGSSTLGGNLAVSTSALVVQTSGNYVGVNTSSPTTHLHVNGSSLISGNLSVQSSASISGNLSISGAIVGLSSVTIPTLSVTGSTTLSTLVATSTVNVDGGVLYVDTTNNRVGISSTSPSTTLYVNGSSQIVDNINVGGDIYGGGDVFIDTNVFVVDSALNRVGINISSPTESLHVVGSTKISGTLSVSTVAVSTLTATNPTLTNLTVSGSAVFDTDVFIVDAATNRVGVNVSSPTVSLDISGDINISGTLRRGLPVTKTSNFSIDATENWIIVDNSGADTEVTFPTASSWTGREIMIKTIRSQTVYSASSNIVPLNSSSAGTAILAATAGKWATLVSNGTNWVIMAGN